MEAIQLSLFGRTCQEPFPATEKTTSAASLKNLPGSGMKTYLFLDLRAESGLTPERSWETVSASRGGCLTRNIGASPSAARESTLWQILQADAPERYYLSAKACQGILRRAEKRGKELPPMLKEALMEAVSLGA